MVKGNFKQIDLLRKRRGSNDLADPYFIDTNKYEITFTVQAFHLYISIL